METIQPRRGGRRRGDEKMPKRIRSRTIQKKQEKCTPKRGGRRKEERGRKKVSKKEPPLGVNINQGET